MIQRAPALHLAPVGLGGFFDDTIGGLLERARDVVEDVVTMKYLRKGLAWAWGHMGADMRALVMKVGPIAAGIYGGPLGKQAAELALGLLEQDRTTREQRKAYKKQLLGLVAQFEAAGFLEPGLIDVDNPEHLEALVLAANMPPDIQDDWFRQRGLAPPARPFAGKGLLVGVLVGAGLLWAGSALGKGRAA